jgi:hypothetical protein
MPKEIPSMIEMKAILAGNAALAQIEAVRKEWRAALKEEGQAIKREYDKTTATWQTKVSFQVQVRPQGKSGMYVEVWAKNRIYWFVHEGIAVMHARLSDDWRPKTQPRVLGSGAGSGHVLYVSKKWEGPLYEPRKFTEEIVKVRQKPFEKRMQHATAVGARKATQGG